MPFGTLRIAKPLGVILKKRIGIMTTTKKEIKTVFVIMPFRSTPTRNKTQLKAFFNNQERNLVLSR